MKREELIAYDKWLTRRKWGTGEIISPEKAADLYLAEHPLPPAEGAEEILDKYPHSTEYPSFIHENSAIAAMQEFATLHAQKTAEGAEKLQKLMTDISEWSNKTFGDGQRNPAIVYHLKKEVNELIAVFEGNPRNAHRQLWFEYADCLMLLLDSALHAGFTARDLIDATREKLEINKTRKWGKPDENGVIEHVEQPQPTAEGAEEILHKYVHTINSDGTSLITFMGALKAMREFAAQQKPPSSATAEEIIESILESLGDPINIHNHAFEIRPYTVDHKTEWWIFHKEVASGEPLAQWLNEFATLHAQQIADKMVGERLRKELIKYDKYIGSRGWIDNYEDWTAITSVDEYLKSRRP